VTSRKVSTKQSITRLWTIVDVDSFLPLCVEVDKAHYWSKNTQRLTFPHSPTSPSAQNVTPTHPGVSVVISVGADHTCSHYGTLGCSDWLRARSKTDVLTNINKCYSYIPHPKHNYFWLF